MLFCLAVINETGVCSSQIKFVLGNQTQIIAMSATLPNMRHLSQWLDATLFTTDFRPVDLHTSVCSGRKLYAVSSTEGPSASLREAQKEIPPLPDDPDGLFRLVTETVEQGKSGLVFCPSKKRCETVAQRTAEVLYALTIRSEGCTSAEYKGGTDGDGSPNAKRSRVLAELRQCPAGLCPILRRTVVEGVAYHHAGLTVDERKVVDRSVCVLWTY